MNTTPRHFLLLSVTAATIAACDALKADPQTSYCEAICDWATECSGETASLDSCLEATRAANSNCADAENGELNIANSALVEECVETVEEATCEGINGSIDEQTTATPSAECVASEGSAAVDAYNAARTSTQTDGETFCEDIGTSICGHVVDCLVGDFGIDEATDALQSACEATAVSNLVTTCKTVDMEPRYGTDPNVNRITANECSTTVAELDDSCAVFTEAAWPAECAAVVADAAALPGAVADLISFAADYGVEVP